MAAVPRRDTPKPLDAALVPLERALRARADALEAEAAAIDTSDNSELLIGSIKNMQALEWRLLADELHHWRSDGELDKAERIVYDRLRHLGCNVAVDPSDPEDCADVAWNAVDALRQAGLLGGKR